MSGVAKKIPSMGALTPIESMLKGGSPSKVLNPKSWIEDTKTVLSKPSAVLNKTTLTGMGKGSEDTLTQRKEDAQAAKNKSDKDNWYGTYGNAEAFRKRVDNAGLQV